MTDRVDSATDGDEFAGDGFAVDQACTTKALAYALYERTLLLIQLAGPNSREAIAVTEAKGAYLQVIIPGNANRYVPWNTLGLDFECPTCHTFITADQEHPLHPQDHAFLLKMYED